MLHCSTQHWRDLNIKHLKTKLLANFSLIQSQSFEYWTTLMVTILFYNLNWIPKSGSTVMQGLDIQHFPLRLYIRITVWWYTKHKKVVTINNYLNSSSIIWAGRDRFCIFFIFYKKHILVPTTNMARFVTILVSVPNAPYNLTNDLLILKSLTIKCVGGAFILLKGGLPQPQIPPMQNLFVPIQMILPLNLIETLFWLFQCTT